MANGIPAPLDTDDDDVAWALQTAQVQWKRGAVADAIVWLRRAVDAAIACGRPERATELNGVAAALTEQMLAQASASAAPEHSTGDSVDELLGAEPVGRASIDIEFDDAPAAADGANPFAEPALPEHNPFAQPGAAPWDPPPPRTPAESVTAIMEPESAMPIASAQVVSSTAMSDAEPVASVELESDRRAAMVSESELIVDSRPSGDLILDPPLPPDDLIEAPTEISHFPSELLPPEDAAPPEPAPPDAVPAEAVAEQAVEAPVESAAEAPVTEPDPEPEPDAAPPAEDAGPQLEGVSLAEVAGLEDLPPEAQETFASQARVEVLDIDEEVSQFAVALILDGWVSIMPAIADAACAHASRGDVVFTSGSLEDSVSLRVVAGESDTRVAVWDAASLEEATGDCPWVADELRVVADRFQALAGAAMGPLGDRLDDGLRAEVTKRCEVKRLLPGEVIVEVGAELPGMHIVGVGRVEIVDAEGERVADELAAGDFLFASEVMSHGSAPATARAGEGGALILFADRMTAHELLVSVPPLLEILAS